MNTEDIKKIASECGAVKQFGYKSQSFYCMTEDELISFTRKVIENKKIKGEYE
jgi:hypothetical protein